MMLGKSATFPFATASIFFQIFEMLNFRRLTNRLSQVTGSPNLRSEGSHVPSITAIPHHQHGLRLSYSGGQHDGPRVWCSGLHQKVLTFWSLRNYKHFEIWVNYITNPPTSMKPYISNERAQKTKTMIFCTPHILVPKLVPGLSTQQTC